MVKKYDGGDLTISVGSGMYFSNNMAPVGINAGFSGNYEFRSGLVVGATANYTKAFNNKDMFDGMAYIAGRTNNGSLLGVGYGQVGNPNLDVFSGTGFTSSKTNGVEAPGIYIASDRDEKISGELAIMSSIPIGNMPHVASARATGNYQVNDKLSISPSIGLGYHDKALAPTFSISAARRF